MSDRTCPKGHDRSAGRWCEKCGQYGSHHTITHAHFTCCGPPGEPEPCECGEAYPCLAQSVCRARYRALPPAETP